mgnify:CR=1 FL=1
MKAEIKKQGKANVEIDFELSWLEFDVYYQKALKQINQGITLDGFRTGKAPKEIVEQKVGDFKILEEAAEQALKENYLKIIKENNFEVIGSPQVEVLKLAKNNDFQVKIKIDILPDVDLPDYQKIVSNVEKKKSQVNDSEVEETIKWIQKSRAKMEETENPAKNGNWVEIEYQCSKIENNKMLDDSFILGEAKLIPGFQEAIEGMKKGEEKEFQAEFPKDYYNKELAGQKADFKLKVKAVKILELSELNDDFAKSLGSFESFEKLKENIKDSLTAEKEMQDKEAWKEQVLKEIGKQAKVDIPESLVKAEQERIIHSIKHEAEHLNVSFEEYLKKMQKSLENIEKETLENAKERIKNYLVLRSVGKKEAIDVLEEEVEKEINKMLASYPHINPQEIDKDGIKGLLYNNKVFEKLYADYSNNN